MFKAYIEGDKYRLGDKLYSGTDAVGKMCRDLETGILKIYRQEQLVLTVDVEKRKTKSLSENDKRLTYINWRPFPVLRGASQSD